MMNMKIIVTAGGTMGHINPALAIIDEFKKHEKNLEVLYIGTHNRMEKDIIPKKNIAYEQLQVYGFTKDFILDIKNIFYIKKAIKKCKNIIKNFQPDVVIGVGGYVTYPVIKAAHELNCKIFIHEQNSIPGKSNKIIAKYADVIGISFLSSQKYFKTKAKIIYTGHPCGAKALLIAPKDIKFLNLNPHQKIVTIVAGSLGSGSINSKMKDFLLNCAHKDYQICYITGKTLYDEFIANTTFPTNVKILPYIDELPGLLKISEVVISRAGAGALSEILSLQIPAIIIPSPNVANNHQYYNALELEKEGCIKLLKEEELTTSKITTMLDNLIHNDIEKEKLRKACKAKKTQNSPLIIYEEIKKICQKM